MKVSDASFRLLAGLLEARTGQQLTMNRHWRVETVLSGLMRERGLGSLDQLIATMLAGQDPALADQVVEALLNNETYFYRDQAAFDLLLGPGLDRLRQARAREKRLNIWCAGCSTGQEAYSLAMHFAEETERWAGWRIVIVGTDVSGSAIAAARAGLYSQFEVQRGLPVVKLLRWFEEEEGSQWRISAELRARVRFEQHALAARPPSPGRFDLILCRNLLLYFSADGRRSAFERLAAAGLADTLLMLGAGETVIGQTELFASDPGLRGLYLANPKGAERRPQARTDSLHRS